MEKLKLLYAADRKEWRAWLQNNFDKEKEIWLVLPKKSSCKLCIPYNDTVEEALCFGWIDSKQKSINPENNAQRFSPRKPKSSYSQPNKERLRWLLKQNLLHPSILEIATKIAEEKFVFPPDIISEIKKDKTAWANYQKFSPAYKRIRVAYIDSARDHKDQFAKRFENFIAKCRENKQIGFGGIEKYY